MITLKVESVQEWKNKTQKTLVILIWHWEIWDSKELLGVEVNQIIMELFLNEKERSSEKDYRTEKKNMQKTWADITQGIKSGADPGKDGRSTFHSFPL